MPDPRQRPEQRQLLARALHGSTSRPSLSRAQRALTPAARRSARPPRRAAARRSARVGWVCPGTHSVGLRFGHGLYLQRASLLPAVHRPLPLSPGDFDFAAQHEHDRLLSSIVHPMSSSALFDPPGGRSPRSAGQASLAGDAHADSADSRRRLAATRPVPEPAGELDSLHLFLTQIGRHRLLTAADEVALAKRIEQGDLRRQGTHDRSEPAARRVCPQGLPRLGVPFGDLIQEGAIGSTAPSRSSTGVVASSSRPTRPGRSASRCGAPSPTTRTRSACRCTSSSGATQLGKPPVRLDVLAGPRGDGSRARRGHGDAPAARRGALGARAAPSRSTRPPAWTTTAAGRPVARPRRRRSVRSGRGDLSAGRVSGRP